ncbi:MAG: hypothetical protein J5716_09335 [Alphaproteobacteria bacterium]|nr:hypothetical protein [Alphaproteobacteria bacterium]
MGDGKTAERRYRYTNEEKGTTGYTLRIPNTKTNISYEVDAEGRLTDASALDLSKQDMTPEELELYNQIIARQLSRYDNPTSKQTQFAEMTARTVIAKRMVQRITGIETAGEKTKEQTEQKEPANKTTFIELNGRKAAVTSVGKDADGNDQYVFLTEDGKNFIPFTKTADGKIKLDVDQRDFRFDESMVPDGLNLGLMMGMALDKAIAAQLKANLKQPNCKITKQSDARPSEPQQPVQNGNAVEQAQNQSRANEVSARNTMVAAQSARTAPNNSNVQANTQVNNAVMSRGNDGR